MAREPEALDEDKISNTDSYAGDVGSNNSLLDRRSYLKIAGATTVAAAAATGAASASGDEYEVIEARGQTIDIGNGETFENKLIDLSTGDGILLHVTGTNVEIRNIGFSGIYRGGGFLMSINAGYGDILVEDVYMADGATKEGTDFTHGPGAVFMHRNNDADVTFRHCNVQGFPNNGFYCSNTAHGGSVHFDTCFGKNNGVTTFRCASSDDVIENCVAYNDNTDYGPGYGGWSETDGRPVWVWEPGGVEIRNSHFDAGSYSNAIVIKSDGHRTTTMTGGAYSGGVRDNGSNFQENDVGSNPDLSVPDGVPTSAEEAAGGESSGGSSSSRSQDPWTEEYGVEYIYEVENTSDDPVEYYLQVSDGEFEPLDYDGAVIDEDQTWAGDDKAAGRVAPGDTHCWGMNHTMVDVTIEPEANAEARVDGGESSLDWYPRPEADGDEWKDLQELLAPDEFEYEVEAHEDDVEYYLEAKEGADFTPFEAFENVYVSEDGTRAAGLLEDGERHGFSAVDVDSPSMLDVTIRGDATGYIDGDESSLDWYPRPDASGDEWKDIDELLDRDDESDGTDEHDGDDEDSDGADDADEWWDDLFGGDEWWVDDDGDGKWLKSFLRTLRDRMT